MARLASQNRGEQSVEREWQITSDLKSTVFGRRHINRTVLCVSAASMHLLKNHPILSILTSLIILGVAIDAFTPKQWTDVEWRSLSTGDRIYCIATGSRDDKLVFVAITATRRADLSEGEGVESIVTGGGSVDENWHSLHHPDGTVEPLPTDRQLFGYIDGHWQEAKGAVSLDQWRSFLKSKPQEITINALLNWIDKRTSE